MGGGEINCELNGVIVQNTALRVVFDGFAARGNSQRQSNAHDGIAIASGTTDFIIKGCTLGGNTPLNFGMQRYGVSVNTGASDRYIIADNLVSGNGTGGVADNGSGSNKRVANNY